MKFDIKVAGVGGQGSLSVSGLIARAAACEGLYVKQSEVHGMSQRGGAVVADLRLADEPIAGDLIPLGAARMILSTEPLEGLRHLKYLSRDGTLVSSTDPLVNIPDYPALDRLLGAIRALPHNVLVDGERLARQAGSARAANMVVVGAASRLLPIKPETLERSVEQLFGGKGRELVEANLRAFRAGREAAP